MRNYLGKLLARHLNRVETLQPRLASLFEPSLPADLPYARQRVHGRPVDETTNASETGEKAPLSNVDSVITRAAEPLRSIEVSPNELQNSSRPAPTDASQLVGSSDTTEERGQPSRPILRSLEQRPLALFESETPRLPATNVKTSTVQSSSPRLVRIEQQPPIETSGSEPSARKSRRKKAAVHPPVPDEANSRGDGSQTLSQPMVASRQMLPSKGQATPRRANDGGFALQSEQLTPKAQLVASPPESQFQRGQRFNKILQPDDGLPGENTERRDGSSGRKVESHRSIELEDVTGRSVVEQPAQQRKPLPPPGSLSVPAETQAQNFVGSAPVLAQPQVTRYVESPSSVPFGPVTPPEQVINVTIGRIEVRATTAPVGQVQKARREQQVLSLDQYLSQRAKGRG